MAKGAGSPLASYRARYKTCLFFFPQTWVWASFGVCLLAVDDTPRRNSAKGPPSRFPRTSAGRVKHAHQRFRRHSKTALIGIALDGPRLGCRANIADVRLTFAGIGRRLWVCTHRGLLLPNLEREPKVRQPVPKCRQPSASQRLYTFQAQAVGESCFGDAVAAEDSNA
jgi:hypothetical protein